MTVRRISESGRELLQTSDTGDSVAIGSGVVKKVLVVGQTPPPFGGQAIMIKNMLEASMPGVEFYHARMEFSAEINEIGKFRIGKLFKLFKLIFTIYFLKLRYGIDNLYYPPAPPRKVPLLRDILILTSCRWMFKNTIFHFHAAGVSEMHASLKGIMRWLFQKAYFNPELAISLSEFNPPDAAYFSAKRTVVVPNGIADLNLNRRMAQQQEAASLLFVGVISESKGVMVLLGAAKLLKSRGLSFKLRLVGHFESDAFELEVREFVKHAQLSDLVEFTGVLTGQQKAAAFESASIFCFPTFFEAETFGLVAVEAMQFGLPVVATKWRGVQSVIRDGDTGYLVSPRSEDQFAGKVEALIRNPRMAMEMGERGRMLFEQCFTSDKFTSRMNELFVSL